MAGCPSPFVAISLLEPELKIGSIGLWSGSLVTIPSGWIVCDGNNGTPDLRDEFVVGAGATYSPDDSGGAVNHTHDFTGDGHSHNFIAGTQLPAAAQVDPALVSNNATGTTDADSNVPPYYSLLYIMFTD